MADFLTYKNASGTTIFSLDDSGNLTVAGVLASTGTDDFGTLGIKADVIAESTSGAGVTIDGLLIKDESIDASGSGIATGDFNLTLKANLADAWSIKDSTGDMVVYTTTTATPGIAETFVRTGAGNAHSNTSTWNSASATGIGLAVSASQVTTARTSGTLTGIKSSVTSLTGDTAGVDYYAFEASVTVGAAGADHFAFRQGAGFDQTIDATAAASTETGWLVATALADAWHIKSASLTYVVLRTTTAAPGIDETFALSGTGDGHNIVVTMSHATQNAEGLDVTVQQITNPRTSGSISAIKATVVSLTGSTAGVDHYAFEGTVTAGQADCDHFMFKVGAGFDQTFDATGCATTEAGWLLNPNVADAWHLKDATRTFAVLRSTTATPGIDETFTLTATGDAHTLTTTVNSAAGVVSGLKSSITTSTTNHTSGTIAAFKAAVTSLAGDTGGDFCALHIVSTDGGGATPVHSGIYCDDPLDALFKFAADGDGGVVVGSTMTISPEATAESGYIKCAIGATNYQIPIYAA